jgi:hypothetical protein
MKQNWKKICLAALGIFLLTANASAKESTITQENGNYVETSTQSFMVQTGGTVNLDTPFGIIEVKSWDKDEVSLSVEKATEVASEVEAKEIFGKFIVSANKEGNDIRIAVQDTVGSETFFATFRLNVPRKFNLDLDTDEGEIIMEDLDGNAEAKSGGGAIRAGNITGDLETITKGGGITIGKVDGTIKAETGGGGIQIQEGGTDTIAKTGGGSVNIGSVNGKLYAKSSGGGISVGETNGDLIAITGGGSITVGPTMGTVTIESGGGGLTIGPATGKVEAETGGGKITIEGSGGPVSAKTRGGKIIFYFPENSPATFDVEMAQEKRQRRRSQKIGIFSEFPLDINKEKGWFGGTTHTATGDINGGGNLIELTTRNSMVEIEKIKK